MAIIEIAETGEHGVIKDLPAHELPHGAWSDGQNVTFRDGIAQKILGHSEIYASPSIIPQWVQPYATSSDYHWIYPGINDAGAGKVYVATSAGHTDITRVSGNYTPEEAIGWTGCILGGLPIINCPNDTPQQWTDVTGKLTDLANWNYGSYTDNICRTLRSYKQFLVALDFTKDDGVTSTRYEHGVKWSHPADPGVEPSSWDETDTSKLAGEAFLSETPDRVIDCLPLRGINIVYKERSCYMMRFIGGNSVFSFDRLFLEHGILSRRCVKPFGDAMHFLVTANNVIIHNGNTATPILDRKTRDWVFNNIDPVHFGKAYVVPNYVHNEMWFCFPMIGSTYPDMVMIWNWRTGAVGFRALPDCSHIAFGIVDDSNTGVLIDGDTAIIDDAASDGLIDSQIYNPLLHKLFMAKRGATTATSKFFVGDDTNQFDGSNMTSYLERRGITAIGYSSQGIINDPYRMKALNAIYPRVRGGAVNVYAGAAQEIGGSYSWEGPYTFTPGTDDKVDVRVEGRLLAVKFEWLTDVAGSIDGYGLDIIPQGRR